MRAFLPLLACFAAGLALRLGARAPDWLGGAANRWLIGIALPATILELVPALRFDPRYLYLVASMVIVFVGAWAWASLAGRLLGWSRERIGAVTLLAGLGNCTFIGYPMLEALRGREGLVLAIVTDQFGLTPVLAIGGSLVAALYAGQRAEPREVLRRTLLFPPFVALVVALVVGPLVSWPEPLHVGLRVLGATMAPVALFWIGLRFQPALDGALLGVAAIGLAWKMLLAPLLMLAVGTLAGISGSILAVGVLQAGMAPMITGAVLAERNGLEPPLVHTMLGLGVLLGFLSVPSWNALL